MSCKLLNICQYETNKLVRIKSVRLGSLKWMLNGVILLFICIMMLWNKSYQEFDFVVSSVTTKVKGVALASLPGVGQVVWDVVDYSGPSQEKNSFFVVTNVIITSKQKHGKCPEGASYGRVCRTDTDCEKGLSDLHSHGIVTFLVFLLHLLLPTNWLYLGLAKRSPLLPQEVEEFAINVLQPSSHLGSILHCQPIMRHTINVVMWNYLPVEDAMPHYTNTLLLLPVSGIQTGVCVKSDVMRKTCEVSAWCPVEAKKKPPRPALLAAAENFTVLIKNNIRFPAFNFIRRNILPGMNDSYLKTCQGRRDPLCPIFRLGDIVHEAKEKFSEMAVEGGVIGIQIKWDCNLDGFTQRCLPTYSFRRLDEKESNKTLYPGLNFRYARYNTEGGVEERTLYKAFGIRFDVMVFGKAGKFSFIQLIIYIGSTLSYYALTTMFIDWLIGTSCYSIEARQNYSERKVESVQDKQQCILSVSFVDETHVRLVRRSQKKCLQNIKPMSIQQSKEHTGLLRAMVGVLQQGLMDRQPQPLPGPNPSRPAWCQCGSCRPSARPQEQLCCRRAAGRCIATSPLFEQLVLSRSLLEAVLLYWDPLCQLSAEDQTAALRHCAYTQYISWRFGVPPIDTHPVVPSCCVWRVREEYSSPEGQYSGFSPGRMTSMQDCSNGKL